MATATSASPRSTNGRPASSGDVVPTFRCPACKRAVYDADVQLIHLDSHAHYHVVCATTAFAEGTRMRLTSGALVERLKEPNPQVGMWKVPGGALTDRQLAEWVRVRDATIDAGSGGSNGKATALAAVNAVAGFLVPTSKKNVQLVPINQPGQRTLTQLEAEIGTHLGSFLIVGRDLLEVSQRRLYLEQMFQSFEEYCEQRWGLGRSHAYRQIDAYRVVELISPGDMSPNGGHALAEAVPAYARAAPPLNERQARELAPLLDRPDELRAAWAEVLASVRQGGPKVKPTAQIMRDVVIRRTTSRHQARQATLRVQAESALDALPEGQLPLDAIAQTDALSYLRRLPDGVAHLCVTSPPYLWKRVYGGGPLELGAEQSPEEYLGKLREILREVKRVLVPSGWLFLVIGDTYGTVPGGYRGDSDRARGVSPKLLQDVSMVAQRGVPDVAHKSQLMVPERLASAMVLEDGWVGRNKIAWVKPGATPANVNDRLRDDWEPVYAFCLTPYPYWQNTGGGNSSVWEIRPGRKGLGGPHPAVFPDELVGDAIRLACPDGGIVLDPFAGSGTVLDVSRRMGRRFLGCDLVDWRAAGAVAEVAGG